MKPNSLEWSEWFSDQLIYHAVQSIEARLGSGYHIKNPRLVCEIARITYEEYLRQEKLEKNIEKETKNTLNYNFVKSTLSKKPNFKFSSFGIPVGAELQCTLDPNIKCIVIDGSNGILYKGNKTSMSKVVKSLKGGVSHRGTQYFTYKGKLLSDMVDQKS